MRRIAIVTVGRSDFGLYRPILRKIEDDGDLRAELIVTGMHLAPQFGMTIDSIVAEGFHIAERFEMLLASDTPEGIAKSVGLGLCGFASAYSRLRPDLLLVLGDRFEMFAAAAAAMPFRIPIAHIHGGESTEGLIDEAIRHSITKMSHLHFVSTEPYRQRVEQMGEEPWRVVVSGAPGLDAMVTTTPVPRATLESKLQLDLSRPPLLVTFHPVTLECDRTAFYVSELLAALDKVAESVVFTYPNADTSGHTIIRMIEAFCVERPWASVAVNLGTTYYAELMRTSRAMVGNSSSGIIEAPTFRLPVVNIGNRQQGRIRAANVIDVGYDSGSIVGGIRRALSDEFARTLVDLVNPYGDGHASARIVARLKAVQLNDELLIKRFNQHLSASS